MCPNTGGARTYIRHGINGFLVDTRDEKTLRAELEAVLLAQPLLSEQVAAVRENAIDTVLRDYSIDGVGERFVDFYGRVLK